jgi:hypothetical protein
MASRQARPKIDVTKTRRFGDAVKKVACPLFLFAKEKTPDPLSVRCCFWEALLGGGVPEEQGTQSTAFHDHAAIMDI